MRSIIIALQLWLLGMGISTVQAGMPNFLMWIGKEQDALIVGEIIKKISPEKQQVKVLAVFPQTKDKSVDESDLGKFSSVVGDKNIIDFMNQQTALVLLLAQPEVIGQLSFYQKVILEWNVSKRLDALAKNDALTKSLLPSIYQLLATNLKKD